MTVLDDHWPALPPIRTSSHNSRVSCETLNIHPSPPAPHSSSNSPFSHRPSSSSQTHKPVSKSVDASPHSTVSSTTTSHFFSHCLPHRFASPKAAVSASTSPGNEGKRGGAFAPSGLLRSIIRFPAGAIPRYSSHMVQFSSAISPSPNRPATTSAANSPSGRMKLGVSTPHSGMLTRSSKGHAANAFTMMPPEVVGKKKPPGYESDEPTSPEVTCIGRVRRKKHRKATWDALVKEQQKNDGRKKGKVKKLSAEFPRKIQAVKKNEEDVSTMAAKLSKQRSGRRKSHDFEGLEIHLGVDKINHGQDKLNHGDLRKENFNDGHTVEGLKKQLAMEGLDVGSKELRNSQRGSTVLYWDAENLIVDPCLGTTRGADHQSNGHDQLSSPTPTDLDENPTPGKPSQDENPTSGKPSQDENPSFQHHEDLDASSCDTTAGGSTGGFPSQMLPPPNCLLLMRKGSKSRSEHCDYNELLEPTAGSVYEHGHTSNHWKWGQVLS